MSPHEGCPDSLHDVEVGVNLTRSRKHKIEQYLYRTFHSEIRSMGELEAPMKSQFSVRDSVLFVQILWRPKRCTSQIHSSSRNQRGADNKLVEYQDLWYMLFGVLNLQNLSSWPDVILTVRRTLVGWTAAMACLRLKVNHNRIKHASDYNQHTGSLAELIHSYSHDGSVPTV